MLVSYQKPKTKTFNLHSFQISFDLGRTKDKKFIYFFKKNSEMKTFADHLAELIGTKKN